MNTSFIHNRDGQLLVEILVAIVVGGIFIVGATVAIVSVIRNNFENRGHQVAGEFAYAQLNRTEELAQSDWHSIADLDHGASSHYFLIPQATSSLIVSGDEGMLFNDVNAGLIGHWKLDSTVGTTAYDFSGYANYAPLSGTPERVDSSDCRVGGCMLFDGSDAAVLSSSPNPLLYTTVSAWFKRNGPSTNTHHIIFMQGTQVELSVPESTGEIRAGVTTATQGRKVFNAGSGLTDGEWHFLTLTYDGSSLKSYIDGVEVSDNAVSGALSTGASAAIGNYASYYANGYIDDVRVYNRAISEEEVEQLYTSSSYRRHFFVENVERDSDGVGDIVESGGSNDPSTKLITSIVEWQTNRAISYSSYVMRQQPYVSYQTDWFDGWGDDGVYTVVPTTFSTSTNIVANTTLTLASTTQPGSLESVIIDTQRDGGVAVNSLLWQGSLSEGSSVEFQFAYSNSSSGPWIYEGAGKSEATYYSPTAPGVPLVIGDIHNYRYLRYKIFLATKVTTPVVDGVYIHWSR